MLADALKVNQSLQNLRSVAEPSIKILYTCRIIILISCYSLDGNGITDKGAGMLADALKVNKSLQNLRSVAESSIH